jgi:hypothetical protein
MASDGPDLEQLKAAAVLIQFDGTGDEPIVRD